MSATLRKKTVSKPVIKKQEEETKQVVIQKELPELSENFIIDKDLLSLVFDKFVELYSNDTLGDLPIFKNINDNTIEVFPKVLEKIDNLSKFINGYFNQRLDICIEKALNRSDYISIISYSFTPTKVDTKIEHTFKTK